MLLAHEAPSRSEPSHHAPAPPPPTPDRPPSGSRLAAPRARALSRRRHHGRIPRARSVRGRRALAHARRHHARDTGARRAPGHPVAHPSDRGVVSHDGPGGRGPRRRCPAGVRWPVPLRRQQPRLRRCEHRRGLPGDRTRAARLRGGVAHLSAHEHRDARWARPDRRRQPASRRPVRDRPGAGALRWRRLARRRRRPQADRRAGPVTRRPDHAPRHLQPHPAGSAHPRGVRDGAGVVRAGAQDARAHAPAPPDRRHPGPDHAHRPERRPHVHARPHAAHVRDARGARRTRRSPVSSRRTRPSTTTPRSVAPSSTASPSSRSTISSRPSAPRPRARIRPAATCPAAARCPRPRR